MKLLFLLVVVAWVVPLSAQTTTSNDMIFSSRQCDPVSCVETAGPSTQTESLVSFNGVCTGTQVPEGINDYILVEIGEPNACNAAYFAHSEVDIIRTELLDDCDDPYYVDTARFTGEVWNLAGGVVYHGEEDLGCDGGESSPTAFGEKPC